MRYYYTLNRTTKVVKIDSIANVGKDMQQLDSGRSVASECNMVQQLGKPVFQFL